jgi:long-chain acyl-CoA synthetase
MIGNKAKIVDVDTRKELGVNETGELILFTPTLMSRYLNKPKETEEAIEKDDNGLLWYKTGDLAHITEAGEIFIDGRIRRIDMVKDETGMPAKLIPDKIKRVVEDIPQVFRCEIITTPDKKYLLKPVIFVELVEGSIYDEKLEKMIYEKCALELPEYMQPKDVIPLEKFPLKPSMKIDWAKLEEQYSDRTKGTTYLNKAKKKM